MHFTSNSVNQAQDLMAVTIFDDLLNSLIPNDYGHWLHGLKLNPSREQGQKYCRLKIFVHGQWTFVKRTYIIQNQNIVIKSIRNLTRSERPIDTKFLNFRYCLNVTIFKYLSINYLNKSWILIAQQKLVYQYLHLEMLKNYPTIGFVKPWFCTIY